MSNSTFFDVAINIIKSNTEMIKHMRYEGEQSQSRLNIALSNIRNESEQANRRMDDALEKHEREMTFLRKEMEKIVNRGMEG